MPREPYIVSVHRKIKTKHHFELDQFSSAETKARYSSFITSVEIYCNNSFYEYYGSSLSRIYEESDPDKSCSPVSVRHIKLLSRFSQMNATSPSVTLSMKCRFTEFPRKIPQIAHTFKIILHFLLLLLPSYPIMH